MKYIISVGCCLVFGFAGAVESGETPDPCQRSFVMPTRIVWHSGGEGNGYVVRSKVTSPEKLLCPKFGQVPESNWRASPGYGCTMQNFGTCPGILLDFGRELHGGLQIAVGRNSTRASRIRIRFGESVTEAMSDVAVSEKGATNDHALRDFTMDLPTHGTRETGNSGFRFVRIDLLTTGQIALDSVRAISIMRPMVGIGLFRSSDERLNRIFDTAARTVHLCSQGYVWDGIKRDRLVWMGDMHPETMALINVFGAAEVIPETLEYVRRTTGEGKWANWIPTYTLCWLRNVAAWYRFTGDRAYLDRNIDYIEYTYDLVRSAIGSEGWAPTNSAMGCFLDWPTHHDAVAERAGAQASAMMASEDVRFLGREAGREGLVCKAEETMAKLKRLRPDPHGAKSAAAMLALAGMREPKEMFAEVLGRNGHAGISTFYGYYMIEAMSAAGEDRRALDTVRDYWGAMLDVGATSFWENFDIAWTNNCFRIDELPVAGKKDVHGDYGEFCYPGFRHSLCHGWSAGPAAWLINHVLGIRPLAPGCKRVEVKPFLGDLEWAEGAMALPDGGAVKVRCRRNPDGSVKTDVNAPSWVKLERRD